jgi:hypothetical protein
MANTKVSDLTITTTPASGDLAYVVDGGNSRQTSLSNFSKGIVVTNLDVTGLTASQLLRVNSGGTAIESSGLSASGSDSTVITGTAGTNGDLAQWNADGDLIDGPTPPSGTIVGTTDTQTLSSKILTAPKIANAGFIADANGNEQIAFVTTASAENHIQVTNAADSGNPDIAAIGDDTNIGLTITPKGTGEVSIAANDLLLATGANVQVNNADPDRIISLPASSWSPTTTSGCASIATIEAGTNDIDYKVLDFDTGSDENAFCNFQMPTSYDGGVIQFRYVWTNAGGGAAETVVFELSGRAYADNDAIDQAVGTAIEVSDTWIAQGDIHISAWSGDVTLAGSPAGGQWVHLEIMRDVSEDDLTGDARLIEIQIKYKQAQYSE